MNQLMEIKDIANRIHTIRGVKVMLDRDLADLNGVETKRLKEQVRRTIGRFPPDFMFELTKEAFLNWRSQFATSNGDKMGLRHSPMAFTEQGVAMLSGVLNSKKAIQINAQIAQFGFPGDVVAGWHIIKRLSFFYQEFFEDIPCGVVAYTAHEYFAFFADSLFNLYCAAFH